MTIWNRLSILSGFVPFTARNVAIRRARRWTAVARADSRLAEDLIILGGIMTTAPAVVADGWPTPDLPPEQMLSYEKGRRDMALQLLALMSLTPLELNTLAQEPDYERPAHDDY